MLSAVALSKPCMRTLPLQKRLGLLRTMYRMAERTVDRTWIINGFGGLKKQEVSPNLLINQIRTFAIKSKFGVRKASSEI